MLLTESLNQWRKTTADRKRQSTPSPASLLTTWWRDSDDEEAYQHTTPSRPITPTIRSQTSTSLPVSSPMSQTTRLHRHAWSLDSLPQLQLIPPVPDDTTSEPSPSSPPSSSFDARQAAQQCKKINGYVSFGAIEGLGMPPMEDDNKEDDSQTTTKSWWTTLWSRR